MGWDIGWGELAFDKGWRMRDTFSLHPTEARPNVERRQSNDNLKN